MLSEEDSRLSAFQNHDRVSQTYDSVEKQSPAFQEQPDALLGTSHTTAKRNIIIMQVYSSTITCCLLVNHTPYGKHKHKKNL
jgi:hypothetical protein